MNSTLLYSPAGGESETHSRFRGWRWLPACLALLALGDVWRWFSLDHLADYYPFSFSHLSYSDIVYFYVFRDLPAHHFPYLHQQIEYPVITGFTMWLTAFAPGVRGYFLTNAMLLGISAIVCLILLARVCPPTHLWRIALAPGLAFYGLLNWDFLAMLELTVGLLCVRFGLYGWAGAALALGFSTKLFPAFVLPAVLAHAMWQREVSGEWSDVLGWVRHLLAESPWRLLGGFVVVAFTINAPVAIVNWQGWTYFLRFQSNRSINPDSIWAHIPWSDHLPVNAIFLAALIFGWMYVATDVWFAKGAGWEEGGLLCLILFLLFTRTYSPQYDMWLLPLLVLLACPLWLWLTYVIVDLVYYVAIFLYLFVTGGGRLIVSIPHPDVMLGIAVWGREIMLLLLLTWGWRGLRRASESRPLGATATSIGHHAAPPL